MKSTPKKRANGERGYADGRAAVLAIRDKLQEWVSAGRTLQAFYDDAKLPISYAQFTRHAARFVSKPVSRNSHANQSARTGQRAETVTPAAAKPVASATPRKPPAGPGAPAPKFTHEPKSRTDDDLI